MSGFLTALTFLTRLPAPGFAPERFDRFGPRRALAAGRRRNRWTDRCAGCRAGLGRRPLGRRAARALAWAAVTGGLHLEGLGDVADGLAAAHGDPKRFVEVAKDPHTGAFGVIAIGLQIAAKLVLLAAFAQASEGDLLRPAQLLRSRQHGRAGARSPSPVPSRRWGEGLASRLAAGVDPRIVALEGVGLAIVSLFVAPILIAAVPIALGLALYWRLRIGGVNGDCHGASIEITESALLLALVLA